jgi:hypothetical protein
MAKTLDYYIVNNYAKTNSDHWFDIYSKILMEIQEVADAIGTGSNSGSDSE